MRKRFFLKKGRSRYFITSQTLFETNYSWRNKTALAVIPPHNDDDDVPINWSLKSLPTSITRHLCCITIPAWLGFKEEKVVVLCKRRRHCIEKRVLGIQPSLYALSLHRQEESSAARYGAHTRTTRPRPKILLPPFPRILHNRARKTVVVERVLLIPSPPPCDSISAPVD